MNGLLLALLLAATMALAAAPAGADVMDHVSFESEGKTIDTSHPSTVQPLEINSVLAIKVDTQGLVSDVAEKTVVPKGEALKDRIELLKTGIEQFLQVEDKEIAFNLAYASYNAAKEQEKRAQTTLDQATAMPPRVSTAGKPAAQAPSAAAQQTLISAEQNTLKARAERDRTGNAFSDAASVALDKLLPYKTKDPELYSALNKAILENYAATAAVLKTYLEKLETQIDEKLAAKKVQVLMTAKLEGEGRSSFLHLEGYDQIETGLPTRFGKLQLVLDERSRKEIESAEKLKEIIPDFAAAPSEAQQQLRKVRGELAGIGAKLWNDEVQRRFDDLVSKFQDSDDAEAHKVGVLVKAIEDAVRKTATNLNFKDITSLEVLLDRTSQVALDMQRIQESVAALPPQIDAALDKAGTVAVAQAVKTETKALLGQIKDTLATDAPALQQLFTGIKGIVDILKARAEVENAAEAASQKAKELQRNAELDTKLELQTIKIPRYPGDQIIISAIILSGDKPMITETRIFRLEKIGPYWETRGALIFVDPRTNRSNIRDINYEAAPAVSFNFHWGFRDWEFWNRDLALGIGPSIALLNFTKSDMEVGIAGNLTLLRGLFWTGYGRNLQAKSDYFYVGINPLALANLFVKP